MRTWLLTTPGGRWLLADARVRLAGKTPACWCALPAEGEPDTCHAKMWAELLSSPDPFRLDVLAARYAPMVVGKCEFCGAQMVTTARNGLGHLIVECPNANRKVKGGHQGVRHVLAPGDPDVLTLIEEVRRLRGENTTETR